MPFERYRLDNPTLIPKPADVPEGYIAYNPSSIWITDDRSGNFHDIMYVRVEPDRSCPECSHLGKSLARPYIVDINEFSKPLEPYYDAQEKMGEDPALTRIYRRLANGAVESIWLLSCVVARPVPDRSDCVETLHTEFHTGVRLDKLEHVALVKGEWKEDSLSEILESRHSRREIN